MIRNGHTLSKDKQGDRLRKCSLIYLGQIFNLVYDRKRREIVTFLPPDEKI
jgi:hypothetical protein